MDAKGNFPAWVDPLTPDRPWVNVADSIPWLRPRPYLIDVENEGEFREAIENAGFAVVEASFIDRSDQPEVDFLQELTRCLRFNELGAGSWGAFNNHLWDFLKSSDSTPYAVIVNRLDRLAKGDIHSLIRCVHNVISLTEGAGLAHVTANRQLEFFFIGKW